MIDLNALRAIADAVRPIAVPIRTTRVTVRTRVWPAQLGIGTPIDTDVTLDPYIKVREVTRRDIASSGGKLEIGDVEIGPITPSHPGGGYTIAQIAPVATTPLTQIIYVLSGAIAGEYRRVEEHTARPLRYMLVLRRKNTTP